MSRTCVTVTFRQPQAGESTFMKVQSALVAHGAIAIQHVNVAGEMVTTIFPLDVVWSVDTYELPERGN